ncbi:MAG TPA: hypothetical protein VFZ00_18395, partial [Solirubrobacter sp.]|nr:hypothetical protein [Solirubrobacter sp.]
MREPRGRGMRYRLLETVREYGLERLAEAGEVELLRDRHRTAFLALAEREAARLESPRQAEAVALLEPDAANLTAALDHALQTDPEAALRMCAALYPFWRGRGRFAEAELAQTRALAAGADAPPSLRARVLVTAAMRCVVTGDAAGARALATEALALVGCEAAVAAGEVDVDVGHVGEGYGRPTAAATEA